MLIAFIACDQSSDDDEHTEPGRVSAIKSEHFPDSPFAGANFSVVLPEGWGIAQSLRDPLASLEHPPVGVLSKRGKPRGQLHYSFTLPDAESVFRTRMGYLEAQTTIDGAEIEWILPEDPSDGTDFLHLEATFASIPGDPDKRFGLSVRGSGLSPAMYLEAKQILESVRVANPPGAFDPPESEVTPGPNWERIEAQWPSDSDPRFSVLAPPGTTVSPEIGFDSLLGTFAIGELEIFFDYGSLSSSPINPDGFIRYEGEAEHQLWVEVIDGKIFSMYRPLNDDPALESYTGISVARIPGLPDLVIPDGPYSSTLFACGGSFFARNISHDDQELVLAVLRTIHAEQAPRQCN